ncbi:hypothetical protein BU14_2554s0001 [Porphyra umbilicalis]|uniref:Uncharacterized protein n=1 Tax=Porphyra umbilicalis TaxID=2786 RepID=A0A1X6NIZ1_PORUM|nr:hypothetical protein BU14_2554s0001 [Porphyra umbilicalis]|eukprot:OSX68575.1 hypothetical protein BU14_2554s0001 [Porphyra umbilicalis]
MSVAWLQGVLASRSACRREWDEWCVGSLAGVGELAAHRVQRDVAAPARERDGYAVWCGPVWVLQGAVQTRNSSMAYGHAGWGQPPDLAHGRPPRPNDGRREHT